MKKMSLENIERIEKEIKEFFKDAKFPFIFACMAEVEGMGSVWGNTMMHAAKDELVSMFIKLFTDDSGVREAAKRALKMIDFNDNPDIDKGVAELISSVLSEVIPPIDDTVSDVVSEIKDEIDEQSEREKGGDTDDVDDLINNCFK